MRRIHSHIEPPQPPERAPSSRARLALGLASEFALSMGALAVTGLRGGPGVRMHARSVLLLARASARAAEPARSRFLASLPSPLDSVRYFEFDFAWRQARPVRAGRLLDASSPRLFPLCLLAARPALRAELANPDRADLEHTRALAVAAAVGDRCAFHALGISDLRLPARSFDLVTSLSVLEHIPNPGDAEAIEHLWSLVRPGGRLIVSVPVARDAVDEYLDVNEYGVLPSSQDGWTFGQHLYDPTTLQERLLSRTGPPTSMEIIGEARPGTFVADRARKASGQARRWREPLAFASQFRRFPSLEALPGWGVVGLAFDKRA